MPSLISRYASGPFLCAVLAGSGSAQRGDRNDEAQPELRGDFAVPTAPARSPSEELQTFRVAPGLRIDLIASEPLLADPVQAVFDEKGRLWVVEMRGYMRDVDGSRETDPIGRVVVLQDRDGDGVMDTSTVFVDRLVLPRAVGRVADGALVLEPPNLWLMTDRDGDLRADERRLVTTGFEAGIVNPEHAPNGLVRGLDNWIECAGWGVRLREQDGELLRERTFAGGQWGLCFDDYGLRYYDYNSDFLRMDAVPGRYAVRTSDLPAGPLWNLQVVADQSTWPIRPTPGVNRAYRSGFLRANGTLAECTAACAPLVDRGGQLPPPYARCAFVCEPAGNLVARFELRPRPGGPGLAGADPTPGQPFLASTDERFRPVNLAPGPDGALYVVDMYRGLIQHRNFVTTFLKKQVVDRKLETPVGLGRIWRVAPAQEPPRRAEDLGALASSELVARLRSANGFVRGEAQRLLIERRALAERERLGLLLREPEDARVRLHALWTLEGLGALTPLQTAAALDDPHPALRSAALRQLETALLGPDPRPALEALAPLVVDPEPSVRLHAALVLGAANVPATGALLARLACEHGDDPGMATAIASGSAGRAAALARSLWAHGAAAMRGRAAPVVRMLARVASAQRDAEQALSLLQLVESEPDAAAREPVLAGLAASLPKAAAECAGLLASGASARAAAALRDPLPERAARLRAAFTPVVAPGRARAPDHERAREAGKALYAQHCAACHQPDARGLAGLAPSLHGAPLLQAPPDRAVRIVLQGLAGPLQVGEERWNLAMPGQPHLDDAQVAAIVTFVRGQHATREELVLAEDVHAVRELHRERRGAWSVDELR